MGYKRVQMPLDDEIPEHMKLWEHIEKETNGKGIAEFMRSLVRLHREGRLIASFVPMSQGIEDDNEDYLDNLMM